MQIAKLEKMWKKLGDIPTDSADEIEIDICGWEKGTYRYEIWYWFDEELPNEITEGVI